VNLERADAYERRRIAANVAKLPKLLKPKSGAGATTNRPITATFGSAKRVVEKAIASRNPFFFWTKF
jgi:hypothetical protein